ncbi:MAG: hypothetical protein K2X48_10385 [Chitinophagaceae bacterium]|nr:hypothetical protein [Chitinophagaceae bacterium]
MMKKKLKITASIFLLLFTQTVNAQFKYKAAIAKPGKTGFYMIAVTPELSSYIKTDFSDIRIADAKGKWVPHIIQQSIAPQKKAAYILHKQIAVTNDKRFTTILFEGDEQLPVDAFTLLLKNAAVLRKASLSGSDDQKNWFIITEGRELKPVFYNDTSINKQEISFPSSKYAFYKLVIDNEKKDPLNVIEITSQTTAQQINERNGDSLLYHTVNPAPKISQTEEKQYTVLKIEQAKPFIVTELRYKAGGSKFFNRSAKLFASYKSSAAQTWNSNPLAVFEIHSEKPMQEMIAAAQSSVFYLLVDNADNPPLQFSNIELRQQAAFLLAELEAGNNYELHFSDSAAMLPHYDLAQFTDRINSASKSLITFGTITPLNNANQKAPKNHSWWIWPAIIAVMSLLLFLTWKLTSEMKQKQN